MERPVNGRLYRVAWLAVAIPLLLLAFTVSRPSTLPRPTLPPTFDGGGAAAIAVSLESTVGTNAGDPLRVPGSPPDLDYFVRQRIGVLSNFRYGGV